MGLVGLCIIAKDEFTEVKKIIKKHSKDFDNIYIAGDGWHDEFGILTGTYGPCTVHYYQYKWINDFADKRNFLASKVKDKYYVRMDCDDELVGAENIRGLVKKADSVGIDCVFCKYTYAKDIDGNTAASHWRETIIKVSPNIVWQKSVHENVVAKNGELAAVKDNTISMIHHIDDEHVQLSNDRNLKILLAEYKKDGENTDPRTLAYIGRSLLGMGHCKEAIPFLLKLVAKSEWDEDKYYAYCQLCDAYLITGQIDAAKESALFAMKQIPSYPDAYLKLGGVYLDQKMFKEALEWYSVGIKKDIPSTLVVLDPTFYGYVTQLNMAMCYLGLGNYDMAWKLFTMANKVAPNSNHVIKCRDLFIESKQKGDFFNALNTVLKYTDKTQNIPSIIPDKFLDDERSWALKNKYSEGQVWAKDTVSIFCGLSYEDWADPSVQMGIGGSEEAVVYLSRELVRAGKKVVVYNQCGDLAGEWNGVTYKNYFEFNPKDEFDTIIFWRSIPFDVNGKNRLVWMHDVPHKGFFNKENESWYDKVLVLSKYHASLCQDVDQSKLIVWRNGINLGDIKGNIDRKKHKIVWTSSYDRGLEELLKNWSYIRSKVSDAELHIFYGWNTYDKMVTMGYRSPDFKQRMIPLLSQEGVCEHGRVGQDELARELLSADVYAYPSNFTEISCISAMRAQACGAIPVTTDYAALDETVKYGYKVHGVGWSKEYGRKLVEVLNSPDEALRKEMMDNKNIFGWDSACKELLAYL
jgi:glycosyltransferase involved in cell wall biosynthesis